MTKWKRFSAAALAGGLVLSAGVLHAQLGEPVRESERTQQMGDMPMGDMMAMMRSCPMMQARAGGPAAALRHREALDLSEAQVRQLEAMQESMREHRQPAMERMRETHRELAEATGEGRLDEARARAALDRMSGLHTDMAMGMLRSTARVREILTPDQNAKLQEMGGNMMGSGMMQMMMRMMMGGDSMGGMEMEGMDMEGGMMDGAGMEGMGMMNMENCPMMQGGGAGGER